MHPEPVSNDVLARMIQAEENEGGPPPPEPCDTPLEVIRSPAAGSWPALDGRLALAPVIHLLGGQRRPDRQSSTLLTTAGLEVLRLALPAAAEIPRHRVPGELTVQCLQGRVAFAHDGNTVVLGTGDLVHLGPNEPHAVKGLEDSTLLVTRVRPRVGSRPENGS